jgi:hypothetical protein
VTEVVPPAPPPVPAAPQTADTSAEILRRLEAIESNNQILAVRSELGLNDAQAKAVRELMQKHALPPQQAHVLASTANPDLFGKPDPAAFPASHGSARPAAGIPLPKPEEKDPEDEYWKKIEQLPSRKAADAINNRLGHLAAEAAGMADSHKLTEI